MSADESRFTATRAELADALTHLRAIVPWPPLIQPDGTITIDAESMADAIIEALSQSRQSVFPETPAEAVTHYTPEEHDQPECDADVAADPGTVMFGTLNPRKVTCPDCLAAMDD